MRSTKLFMLLIALITTAVLSGQVRLKDISAFSGLEARHLVGYGLVIGLDGTGDGSSSQMTVQSIKNMMERFGVTVPMNKIRPNNVAAVMVTATMPAFAKTGTHFDVTVSSVGDAKSLEGGTLLMTPLISIDQKHFASAQGPLSIGGSNVNATKSDHENHPLVARIPGGGVVEKEVFSQLVYNGELMLNLHNPDFTTANRVASAVNRYFNMRLAAPEDAATVQIIVPDSVLVNRNLIGFVAQIENLEVIPEQPSRVVINERTGTVVAGGNVELSQVMLSHGNLSLKVEYSPDGGSGMLSGFGSMGTRNETVMTLESATVQELVQALNAIRVRPRDLIAIFQSLKASGALQAELEII